MADRHGHEIDAAAPAKGLRERAGLTLDGLAEKLRMSKTTIFNHERVGSAIKLATLQRTAQVLGYRVRLYLEPLQPAVRPQAKAAARQLARKAAVRKVKKKGVLRRRS